MCFALARDASFRALGFKAVEPRRSVRWPRELAAADSAGCGVGPRAISDSDLPVGWSVAGVSGGEYELVTFLAIVSPDGRRWPVCRYGEGAVLVFVPGFALRA